MFTSSMKRRIGRFYVVAVQWTSKKCTKKRDARAEQLALLIKPQGAQNHNSILEAKL